MRLFEENPPERLAIVDGQAERLPIDQAQSVRDVPVDPEYTVLDLPRKQHEVRIGAAAALPGERVTVRLGVRYAAHATRAGAARLSRQDLTEGPEALESDDTVLPGLNLCTARCRGLGAEG